MAMSKLKNLHNKILKNKPTFLGNYERKIFCAKEARKLYNFLYLNLYNKIIDGIDSIEVEMKNYYKTFFCVICDAQNHRFINLKTKRIELDYSFC